MEYTKEELRKVFNATLRDIDNFGGRIGGLEIRKLCDSGIPIIRIALENIPRNCLIEGFEKWLKSL
jgi:hypothetical protein